MDPPEDHGQPAHLPDRPRLPLRSQAHGRISGQGRPSSLVPRRTPDAHHPDDEALRRHRVPHPQNQGEGHRLLFAQCGSRARCATHRLDSVVSEGLRPLQPLADSSGFVAPTQRHRPHPNHPLVARRDGAPAVPSRDGSRSAGRSRSHCRNRPRTAPQASSRRCDPEAADLSTPHGRHRALGRPISALSPPSSAISSGRPHPGRSAFTQCQRHARYPDGIVGHRLYPGSPQLLHRSDHSPAVLPTRRHPRHHHLPNLPPEGQAGHRPARSGRHPIPPPRRHPDGHRSRDQDPGAHSAQPTLWHWFARAAIRIRCGQNTGRNPLHFRIGGHSQGGGAHPRQSLGQHPTDGCLPRHFR